MLIKEMQEILENNNIPKYCCCGGVIQFGQMDAQGQVATYFLIETKENPHLKHYEAWSMTTPEKAFNELVPFWYKHYDTNKKFKREV